MLHPHRISELIEPNDRTRIERSQSLTHFSDNRCSTVNGLQIRCHAFRVCCLATLDAAHVSAGPAHLQGDSGSCDAQPFAGRCSLPDGVLFG
jgi:hypothetical protein